jgi:hypothetical protein
MAVAPTRFDYVILSEAKNLKPIAILSEGVRSPSDRKAESPSDRVIMCGFDAHHLPACNKR